MYRLILTVGQVPEHFSVCKPTGQKQYVVRRNLKIYGLDENPVKMPEGIYLVDDKGGITFTPSETKVALDFENLHDLSDFVNALASHGFGY